MTPDLRVVGVGLPRTATSSLRDALQRLLGGACLTMSALAGHPFDLGAAWRRALAGEPLDPEEAFAGFVATVDWPGSIWWRDLVRRYPKAVVILSTRDSAQVWWESMDATVLGVARQAASFAPGEPRDLVTLLERFVGSAEWDHPAALMDGYERHNAEVRASVPSERLVDWRAEDGWEPICRALGVRTPDEQFPWTNRREDWG
ncbi:MAG: sulfotransferase family protein [Actinomycetota bacterium]